MATKIETIYGALRADIDAGRYRPGDKLPALPVLMERFGVARDTVRDAVHRLAADGWVEPRRGIGTVVQDRRRG